MVTAACPAIAHARKPRGVYGERVSIGMHIGPDWIRVAEWWEFKLVPALTMGVACALQLGVSPVAVWPAFVWLLVALIPGGVFVSILNDLTDREGDRRGGKHNRLLDKPIGPPMALALICLAVGAAIAWVWRDRPQLVGCYAAGWIAYLAYSMPPMRLKVRGWPGAVCDAIGANVVPGLLASLLVADAAEKSVGWPFLLAVTVWTLCFGLRGILWHQIADAPADRQAGQRTFVIQLGIEPTMALARTCIFPLEILALVAIVVQTGPAGMILTFVAAALYIWQLRQRLDRFVMVMTLVKPRPRSTILMHEYYDVFLPIALIIAASIRDPENLIFLLLYTLLFPVRLSQVCRDTVRLLDPTYEPREK